MSTVEVALTDTRLWARSAATHWDAPPSIVPTSDRAGFVVGEPLVPQNPAVSVVRLAAADRIAFGPALPTTTDALATIFGAVLTNLRLSGPCDRLTVVTPSEWGMRRRHAVEAAGRRLAAEVTVEPLALRAAALNASIGQQQRIAVLELSPLSTTVTLVGRSGQQSWIEACEHEPTVGAADIAEGRAPDAVAAVVARLLAGRTPNYLVALGVSEEGLLETLREAISRQCGFPVDVRTIAGAELIRSVRSPISNPTPPAPPSTEWVGSLRERAEAVRPQRPHRILLAVGAVAVAVVVAAGVSVAVLHHNSSPTASVPTSATPAVPPAVTTAAEPEVREIGRVRIHIPAGWQITGQSDGRIDLTPTVAAHQRITVIQKTLSPGTTLDDVATALEAQIRQRPAGTFGPLHPAPAIGGRRALAYDEFPSDGTTVRWQVIADDTTQASIGCQSTADTRPALAPVCDGFLRGLELTE
ncbi:type VII secretion-associated protein [Nocardia sp. NPDC051570]|uniref:type VII secretion-associated protein n=1 Tax=Nocardia sp. NPDC051570 TaxID=3364324 RepID=UPI0037A491BD